MWQIIVSGLGLGLVSSFHCVGMCGPLALSLPVSNLPAGKRTLYILLYHFGRLFTYVILGLLFGLLGRRIYLAGMQQWLSIISGIIILFFALQYFIKKNRMPAFINQFYVLVTSFMMKQLKNPSFKSFLLLGMGNGLLPCGMVYIAIAVALSTNSMINGALLMCMFGAGTFPAMIALSYAPLFINIGIRNKIKKAMPVLMAIVAVLLILRGLNLGIPYISPVMAKAPKEAVICH